jgi:nickel transport protein
MWGMSARGIVRSSAASPLAAAVVAAAWAGSAAAHGAVVALRPVEAVAVEARYDTGAPMRDAQVSVFAPDDPARPRLVGRTDAGGRFLFAPDGPPGRWAVQARQAGHGAIGHVEVGAGAGGLVAAGPGGVGPLQRALMVACVLWGAVGTALYFRRPRGAV